jgi:hypothetical protein
MAYEDALLVVSSAAKTTTGQTGALAAAKGQLLHVLADVTAASGTTPSLTLSVEWSMDAGTTWAQVDATADAFAAVTATGTKVKTFNVRAPYYRLVWTITGTTPSFTFSARSYVTTQ